MRSIFFLFVKLQKAYKSAFLVKFVVSLVLPSAPGECLVCMVALEMSGLLKAP